MSIPSIKKPVKQAKLSDVIQSQLETMILEGSLKPGQKLPAERELAKQFDVSRPSLREAIQALEPILGRKRAKESARFFKTYNSKIQADVTFNMRSFANFQKLRNSEHAQKEIRELADDMLTLVKNIKGNPFEHTLAIWEKTL